MWRSPEARYDVASGLSQGGREYQEDAIISDFPEGADCGFAILADGMGGHEAGDVASKLAVGETFTQLKSRAAEFAATEHHLPHLLTHATTQANEAVRAFVKENPAVRGMGTTLVSLVLVENRMHWTSVGDSPLYLLRKGALTQLNEDHSFAPQIDFMVQQNLIDAETAMHHPDRNALTSVIMGEEIAKLDCPQHSFDLKLGDVVVLSSDGLQYLDNDTIEKIVHRHRKKPAAEIVGYLLEAIDILADPDQDNVAITVIKLNHMKAAQGGVTVDPVSRPTQDPANLTRMSPADSSGVNAFAAANVAAHQPARQAAGGRG